MRIQRRVSASVAVSGLIAASGLLVAPQAGAVPTADPAPTVTYPAGCVVTGNIELLDKDSGASVGFIRKTPGTNGIVSSGLDPDDYQTVTTKVGSQQNLVIGDTLAGTQNVGLSVGYQNAWPTNVLALGAPNYVMLSRTATTAAGATPTPGTSETSSTGREYESAVWTVGGDLGLVGTWINPDGSPAPTLHLVSELKVGQTDNLHATPDVEKLRASWPSLTLPERLARLVPTGLPSCGQAIGFTSTVPAVAYPEGTYDIAATGGASGNPVTFSSATPLVCSVATARVTFLKEGTCRVAAYQAGNADLIPGTATQEIVVTRVPSTVSVSVSPSPSVSGQAVTPRATVTPAVGDPAGTVQFGLDGEDLGAPQPVAGDGTASYPALPVPVGTHRLTAEYVPSNGIRFAGSSGEVGVVVAKAATTTTLSTGRDWIKTVVAPVAPGAGTPSGSVEFFVDGDSVGTAGLSGGTAQLAYGVPAGEHVVSSKYLGDDSFLGSVASTSRKDPVITAQLSSAGPPRAGWYRSAVTVRYSCTVGSAPLTGPCPAPVTVSGQGGSTLSRTIEATDGGLAVVNTVVNIDRTRPSVQLSGVRAGGRYFATGPRVLCTASDPLSGWRRAR